MNSTVKVTALLVTMVMVIGMLSLTSEDSVANPTGGWDEHADTTWYTGHENDTGYTLVDAADLAGLAKLVNENGVTFQNKTISLTPDTVYDLSAYYWIPIGNSARSSDVTEDTKVFSGTFDGAGSTISGLTDGSYTPGEASVDSDNEFLYGLFGFTNDATIKNLTLTEVNIDVYENGSTLGNSVGALVGYGLGTLTITEVSVSGTVTAQDSSAGVVGRFYGTSLSITDSNNSAIIYSPTKTGGFVGYAATNLQSATFTNCSNSGSIKGTLVGGIVGMFGKPADISTSISFEGYINNGAIVSTTDSPTSQMGAGGILGWEMGNDTNTGSITITGCNNTGDVCTSESKLQHAGGIVGYDNGTLIVENCTNSGSVYSIGNAGGIVGYNQGQLSIKNSKVTENPTISGGSASAGIVATIGGTTAELDSCTVEATISAPTSSDVYGQSYGYAVGKVSQMDLTISNMSDTSGIELIGVSYSTGDDQISLMKCDLATPLVWAMNGAPTTGDCSLTLSLEESTLAGVEFYKGRLIIESDDSSRIGSLVAGSFSSKDYLKDLGETSAGGVSITISSGTTLNVGTCMAVESTEEGFTSTSNSVKGVDSDSSIIVESSGTEAEFMSAGAYSWEDDAWKSYVDTSAYAGKYYAQKEDGIWFLAVILDDRGNGIAYKAYPNEADNKPESIDTQEPFVVTSIDTSDSGEDKLYIDLIERTDQSTYLQYTKAPGTVSWNLHTHYKSLVGTESKPVYDLYRAAPEGEEWFDYSYDSTTGFVPYYLVDAVELGRGNVTITINSGEHSLAVDSTDFHGTSLTVQAVEGADIVIHGFTVNGNTENKPTLTLEGLTFDGVENGSVSVGLFSNVTVEGCTFNDRVLSVDVGKIKDPNTSTCTGSTVIRDCTFNNVELTDDLYAASISNGTILFEGNTVDGYSRGANLRGAGTDGGSITATGNTISNLLAENEGAIQIAESIGGKAVSITDNTISNCKAAIAVHDGCAGTPSSFAVSENTISGTSVGILYKTDGDKIASQVQVDADNNLYVGTDGIATAISVSSDGGADTSGLVKCDTWYVDEDKNITNEDLTSDVQLVEGFNKPIAVSGNTITMSAAEGAQVNLDVTFGGGDRLLVGGTVSSLTVTVSIKPAAGGTDVDAMYDVTLKGITASGTYTITLGFDTPVDTVVEDVNVFYYVDASTRGDEMPVESFDSDSVTFTTTHLSLYGVELVTSLEPAPEPDDPSFSGDEDDYVPLPPSVNGSSGSSDDTVTIVACAAAAVVAALMAVFLVLTYRKD